MQAYILFKSLPAELADLMRERLECEKQGKTQQKSQKQILRRSQAPAGGNGEQRSFRRNKSATDSRPVVVVDCYMMGEKHHLPRLFGVDEDDNAADHAPKQAGG